MDNNLEEEDNDVLEMLETRIKAAQSSDETCKRIIKKLQDGDRLNHKVTLAHTSILDNILLIDNKL